MTSNDAENEHSCSAYELETMEETPLHYISQVKTYDLEIGAQNRDAQPVRTAKMSHRFSPNQDIPIQDAGCGSGPSGEALKQMGYSNIHGCDLSPDMLEIAQAKQFTNYLTKQI